MKLKVCGMRDLDNCQRLIAEVQPDWMGIILYPPSPRYVPQHMAANIHGLMVEKVGVFVNESLENIEKSIADFGLSALQFHGAEAPEFVENVKNETGLEILKVISVKDKINWTLLEEYLPCTDYFLFDTYTKQHGGSGKQFNWNLLEDYPFEIPFLLSGGIGPDDASTLKQVKSKLPKMAGVDINSGFELSPGLKEIEKINEFKRMVVS